jgi:hypothetical protein
LSGGGGSKHLVSTPFEQRFLITQHAVIVVDAQDRSLSAVIEHRDLFTPTAMITDVRRPRLVKFAHSSRQFAEHVDLADLQSKNQCTGRNYPAEEEACVSTMPECAPNAAR